MRLVDQRNQMQANITAALDEIQWMREHLASPKFQGTCEDNINVRDVDTCILRIKANLMEGE